MMSTDERPPLHQSLWFPVAPESRPESSQDEPAETPAPNPAPPPPHGLGWKAPSRVRVPVFVRDAAQENTTLSAAPRIPTADDETVRQLREHIIPDPMPLDYEDDGESAATIARADSVERARIVDADFDPDFQEVRRESAAMRTVDVPGVGPVRIHPGNVDFQVEAGGPTAADFAARFHGVVNFVPPDPIPPPKGAQPAQALADSCGRDAATPNDGGVPQGITVSIDGGGSDDQCSFAFWSNGTFSICPSDGLPLVLNRNDTREMLRYVSESLSARARAAA